MTLKLRNRQPILQAILLFSSGAVLAAGTIDATATYTDTLVSPGEYQYNLTLDNTGGTTIGTFWFGWVPGAGFLPALPTDITTPAGWTATVTNTYAIEFATTTDLLPAGSTLPGFGFESTMTPAELAGNFAGPGTGTGDPVATSFVYIAAAFGDPGLQITATPAGGSTVPEPSTWMLMAAGAAGLVGWRSRHKASQL